MIKTLILTSFFAAFALIAMPITSAQACSSCGCADAHGHSHGHDHAKNVPCEKTLGDKKAMEPCEKTLGDKKSYNKKAKKHHKMKHKKMAKQQMETSITSDQSSKGSLTFKSGQPIKTRGTANYNE